MTHEARRACDFYPSGPPDCQCATSKSWTGPGVGLENIIKLRMYQVFLHCVHILFMYVYAGVIPTTGWANDPFGYSPVMAYFLREIGVESMMIQRVHYSVKKHLAQRQQLEFGWLQQWDHSGYETGILCHLMPFYSYDIPHTCGPSPKVRMDGVRGKISAGRWCMEGNSKARHLGGSAFC